MHESAWVYGRDAAWVREVARKCVRGTARLGRICEDTAYIGEYATRSQNAMVCEKDLERWGKEMVSRDWSDKRE